METMEPAETPSQAIKDGFPNNEPDLDCLKLSPNSTFEDGPRLFLESTSQAKSHPPTPKQRSLEKAGSKVRVIEDESATRGLAYDATLQTVPQTTAESVESIIAALRASNGRFP
jgi:hypothetical protein